MDLKKWRQEQAEGKWFTLPSGLPVRCRRVSLFDLVAQGEIPDDLSAEVNAQLSRKATQLTLQDFSRFGALVDLAAQAALTEPAVTGDPETGFVSIEELPMVDRIAIFNWANDTAQALKPFRSEPASSLDSA